MRLFLHADSPRVAGGPESRPYARRHPIRHIQCSPASWCSNGRIHDAGGPAMYHDAGSQPPRLPGADARRGREGDAVALPTIR